AARHRRIQLGNRIGCRSNRSNRLDIGALSFIICSCSSLKPRVAMNTDGDVYGRRTLDFVERLQKLKHYDEICVEIQKELAWFGLSCVTAWSMPGPGRPPDEGVLLNTRPQQYIEHYKEMNYLVRDPMVTELRHTVVP